MHEATKSFNCRRIVRKTYTSFLKSTQYTRRIPSFSYKLLKESRPNNIKGNKQVKSPKYYWPGSKRDSASEALNFIIKNKSKSTVT
jgi:hypothetical protein